MASGDRTPLFNWPEFGKGETWDAKTKRHIYPSSKDTLQAANVVQHLMDVERRVTAVLNVIDYDAGNIHRMIAKDLASPAAEDELALLPKIDYCSVKYAVCISEKCKAMLRSKIERYKRQHAHNLALEGMVDVVLKWQCSAKCPQPLRMLPENEFAYVQIAHDCRYKYLNWNLEHAEEKEHDEETKAAPGECRKPPPADKSIPSPPASHSGGFYACVIQDLLPFLEKISEAWKASVHVVVHPKSMAEDEQHEMDAYHAVRRQAEEVMELKKALVKVEVERTAKEEEQRPRIKRVFPRHVLIERQMRDLGV